MKKQFLLLLLVICCLACVSAVAAPAMTDGTVSGWIAENGYLDWQAEDGTVLQIPVAMEDILEIQDGKLICLAKDGRVLSVQKEGYQALENADPESLRDQRISLADGQLTYEGTAVSETACAAATDGLYLYYVEKNGNAFTLCVRSVQESENPVAPESRDAYALAFSGKPVTEPLSLTVTKDALTMTDTEHRVLVMNLTTGVATEYPPMADENTTAACAACDILYRYTPAEDQKWAFESSFAMTPPASVPTPAPTPVPTPAPTPAPTAKPTPTPANLIDDDGTVYFGAYGSTVRKIQKRLDELGYPTGKVDGKYGDMTQLAINLFCDAIHVREHNYIPPKVQRRLFAADAPVYDPYLPLKKGDRGVSVLYMQVRLKELGYDPQKLDGIYGEMTVAAVALFQQDYGIVLAENEKPGEVASHEMLEKLFAPEPVPTVTPEPTPTATPVPTPTAEPSPDPTPTPTYATQTDLK